MVFDDSFDASLCDAETLLLLDHATADSHYGASVFWLRRPAAFGGEQATIEFWQNETAGAVVSSKSWRKPMINSDQEFVAALDRIRQLQGQLALLRKTEANPTNYRLSASGFIAEIDRMQLEVREYLSTPATVPQTN